ncbi:MAG: hypothetical protein IJI11_01530 [Mogibacterium sp.]|nr:hypothetical protein [Mogibacterium sp.]
MLTIDELKALGADTDDGITRCMGKEDFYLRMVKLALSDDSFEKMKEAILAGNLDEGFERAHALKGILANVSLTSLYEPVATMTEDLRARKDIDYTDQIAAAEELLNKYRALL